MAKNKFSKDWLHQHINDPYVKMAQQKGYRARAAFKLLEIVETEKLLRRGDIVVDLGSAPGSWSQVARERLVGAAIHHLGETVSTEIVAVPGLTAYFLDDVVEEVYPQAAHKVIRDAAQ